MIAKNNRDYIYVGILENQDQKAQNDGSIDRRSRIWMRQKKRRKKTTQTQALRLISLFVDIRVCSGGRASGSSLKENSLGIAITHKHNDVKSANFAISI